MALRIPADSGVEQLGEYRFPRTLTEAFGPAANIHITDTETDTTFRDERNAAVFCLTLVALLTLAIALFK